MTTTEQPTKPDSAESVRLAVTPDHVATIEFSAGKFNYFSITLIDAIVAAAAEARNDHGARAIVLTGKGKHFCAGANFSAGNTIADAPAEPRHLYDAALDLYRQPLPLVAAIHGAAIGGGLGLAMTADFRIADDTARFSAPFARLGVHHGFGLSVSLPWAIGNRRAAEVLYEARRIPADEALAMGLCDAVTSPADLLTAAHAKAARIAESAPIATQSMRRTMRRELVESVADAMAHERAEQAIHAVTADHKEGVAADIERRTPTFEGR